MRIMKQLLIVAGLLLLVSFSQADTVYSAESQSFFKRVEGQIGYQSPPTESATPESEENKKEILVVDTSKFPNRAARPLKGGINLPKTGSILSNWIKYIGAMLMLISIRLIFRKSHTYVAKK